MFSSAEMFVLLCPLFLPLYTSLSVAMLVPQSKGSKIQNLSMLSKKLKTA